MRTELKVKKLDSFSVINNGNFADVNNIDWNYIIPDWDVVKNPNGIQHTIGNTTDLEYLLTDFMTTGDTYTIRYTIYDLTAGNITLSIGGATGPTRTKNGTYVEVITLSNLNLLKFSPSSGFNGTVTGVEVYRGLYDFNTNTANLDLYDDEEILLNFNIADIKDISKKNTNYSKTFKIPGTRINNNFFNNIYELGIGLTYFNPNKKTYCQILVDTIVQFEGFLQLLSINRLEDNQIEYEVVIFGQLGNLFSILKDCELTDLDFSEYNHPYTKEIITKSWDTSIIKSLKTIPFYLGRGYVYPLENRGRTLNSSQQTRWDVEDMFPAIYLKEYINKIFKSAGYTVKSNFFNSEYFRKIIIPSSKSKLFITDIQARNKEYLAEVTIPFAFTNYPLVNNTTAFPDWHDCLQIYSMQGWNGIGKVFRIYYDNNKTAPSHDPSGVFLTGTTNGTNNGTIIGQSAYVPNAPGNYTLNARVTVGLKLIAPNTSTTMFFNGGDTTGQLRIRDDNNPNSPVYTQPFTIFKPTGGYLARTIMTTDVFLSVPFQVAANPNVKWVFEVQFNTPKSFLIVNNVGVAINGAEIVPTIKIHSNSYSNVTNNISEGDTMNINSTIQEGIKCSDFISSVIKAFNLYIVDDKDVENQLIIEPRDNYYSSSSVKKDWTTKLDRSSELLLTPMSELDAKRYIFTYNQADDYYNTDYSTNKIKKLDSKTNRIYGDRIVDIDNDFNDTDSKVELIFKPTVNVLYTAPFEGILPTWVNTSIINGVLSYSEKDPGLTMLFYGGLITTQNRWRFTSVVPYGTLSQYKYPYAGMFNNPLAPTEDLCFGLNAYYYYSDTSYAATGSTNTRNINTITNSNLYNKFYRTLINQITDKDSALLTAYFYLTPQDINTFDFRDSIQIDYVHYRVNKIIDYNPLGGITKVELIKIPSDINFKPNFNRLANARIPSSAVTSGQTYNTSLIVVDNEETFPIAPYQRIINPNGNEIYDNPQAQTLGKDNWVGFDSESVSIIGDNNKVGGDASNIQIIGTGNTINGGLDNIQIIGANNQTIKQSNVILLGNGLRITDGFVEYIINVIDGGNNEIEAAFDDSIINKIDGGLDQLYIKYSDSITNKIDSGLDSIL